MSEFLDRLTRLSPRRLALLAMELQTRLDAAERGQPEPIAVVGMGCRFPGGVANPADLWRLLRDGVDAVSEVPPERWDAAAVYDPDPDAPGKMNTRWGGFLGPVDGFDAPFFGIAPREAASMDPQQRLLLEVAWEALEHAGIAPESLEGSSAGVFLGICNNDYAQLLLARGEEAIDAYMASGSAHSIAAGRLAYVLGVHGPNVAIDTACSSSLVAVHLAVQSLRAGECAVALACGVNLILTPDITVALAKAHMMAPDGRCKTFDAAADGFVRGEGCGVVVLKRLRDARADGDAVLAVIRGSALNQDGRSNGITAPNGPAQEAVIRAALANAGVAPHEVGLVEAHGTGTALGDPIEVQALGAVLAAGRPADQPLMLGSIKTNLGHLEAAAGIAGLIKAVLALQHGAVPPHLHLRRPSEHIPWDQYPLTVPTALTPWHAGQGRRVAGVSSFGFSGTNAHVVLEEAPPPDDDQDGPGDVAPRRLLPLSARSQPALAALVERYVAHLDAHPGLSLADVCATAGAGRSHFAHRLAVVAGSPAELRARLAAHAAGEAPSDVRTGVVRGGRRLGVAFLFTGQGSQYAGMARELYRGERVFRAALDRCAALLQPHLERPLLDLLFAEGPDAAALLDLTTYTQPALFAVEYALAELWRSWGVTPSALLGHSVGEYVAACLAGVFSLEDALLLIAARGRLMGRLPAGGAMAALTATPERAAAAVAPYGAQVSLAAMNGPASTVIAGARAAVEAICRELEREGVRTKPLAVSHAFHSPLMEPVLAEFRRVAEGVRFSPPRIPIVSNVGGALAGAEMATADYWVRQIRAPVQFAAGVEALHAQGCAAFVEIGPQPVLLGMARQCLAEGGQLWLPSLRQGRPDREQLLESLAALYVAGAPVSWAGVAGEGRRGRPVLPTYPFQRERYWLEPGPRRRDRQGRRPSLHPLIGHRVRAAVSAALFETPVGLAAMPFLEDHRVYGTVILPSPVYLAMALAAAEHAHGARGCRVEQFTIHEALIVPDEGERTVQLTLTPESGGGWSFAVLALAEGDAGWRTHASGRLLPGAAEHGPAGEPLGAAQARCAEPVAVDAFYAALQERGFEFGQRFRGVEQIRRRDGEAVALMALPTGLAAEAAHYSIHPALLDTCLHILGAALPASASWTGADPYLLIGLEALEIFGRPGARLWNHASIRPAVGANTETITGDLRLFDEQGAPVAALVGLQLKRAGKDALLPSARSLDDWLYEVRWQPAARPALAGSELAPAALPEPARLAKSLDAAVAGLRAALGVDGYNALLPLLDALCGAYVLRALARLGWVWRPGQRVAAAELMARLHIGAAHERLVGRMLAMLAEDGVLRPEGAGWSVTSVPEDRDPAALLAELQERFPAHGAELALTARCASALAEVLRGEADPLQLLFPGGSLESAENLYERSPSALLYNRLARDAVVAAAAELPAGRRLRVLEIGGGTGGTTAHVLPALPAGRADYLFTDVSPLFTRRAEAKFGAFPFVRYGLLDIGRDPAEQGLAGRQFDLVLAANVLHATPDIAATLRHVRKLLAPAGLLVLIEGTAPQRFGDLTVGLTEGWWAFRDTDLRPDYALMGRDAWARALAAAGFEQPAFVPARPQDGDVLAQQALILARAPNVTRESPLAGTLPAAEPWLIFADTTGVGQALAGRLAAHGAPCVLVAAGESFAATDPGRFTLRPERPEDYRELVRVLVRDGVAPAHVVHLWSLGAPPSEAMSAADLEGLQVWGCASALFLVQALLGGDLPRPPGLCLVTRGAQQALPGEPTAAAHATIWGLGNTVALEHPELACLRVDLDASGPADVDGLLDELLARDGAENQIALRGRARLARRLERASVDGPAPRSLKLRPDASYLITGGLSGLGLLVAERLVAGGARHLVLMGRSAPGADAQAAIDRMGAAGACVVVARGDVSQHEHVERVLDEIGRRGPPLAGVVHSAGTIDDGVLLQQSWERFARVMAAKVAGTWNLHTLTRRLPLDFFVLFSSGVSLLGTRGQANHAAANAFVDALAHQRAAAGLPALSINWGPWSEVGAVVKHALGERLAGQGLAFIEPQQGLAVLEALIGRGEPQVAVLPVEWPQLLDKLRGEGVPPFLASLAAAQPSSRQEAPAAAREPSLAERLASALPSQRPGLLLAHVRRHAAAVLRLDPAQLDPQQPLGELGLDSLMAVELRNVLGGSVERALPATLTYEYPSVAAIADFLGRELDASTAEPLAPAAVAEPPAPQADLDDLSEDELASLLASKLSRLR